MPPKSCQLDACEFCQRMIVDVKAETPDKSHPSHFIFEPTLDDLLLSEAHCTLARWLLANWSASNSCDWADLRSRSREIRIGAEALPWTSTVCDTMPIEELSWIGLWDPRTPPGPSFGRFRVRTRGSLCVVASKDDPAAPFIGARPVNRDQASEETFELARGWIRECLEEHEKCLNPRREFMPRIILRVGESPSEDRFRIQLHFPSSPEPYIALSYCWGGDQPQKTLRSRISSGQFELDWDTMPRTIQDAVRVTVRLGYSNLWVDSLCIVQDDEVDKAQQIAMMPQIYNEAVVTVIASKSNRVTDGFLDPIKFDKMQNLAVQLPFRCHDGSSSSSSDTLGTITLLDIRGADEPEPIDLRAWTFQERYLSERSIEFDSKQCRWDCGYTEIGGGQDALRLGPYTDGWRAWQEDSDLRLVTSFRYVRNALRGRDDDIIVEWRVVLGYYTRRRLTFPADRILALSGVAARFGHLLRGDEYLAGHWRRHLPQDLLWHVKTGRGSPRRPRPGQYQAPSWSWAGVNGEVLFLFARAVKPGDEARADLVMSVTEAHTELQEPTAKYGAVTSGYLRVLGRLRKAVWIGGSSPQEQMVALHSRLDDGTLRPIPCLHMMPDALEDSELHTVGPVEVHLLQVGVCSGLKKRGPVGLVLFELSCTTTYTPRRFSRLGLFHIDPRLRDSKPEAIDQQLWDKRVACSLELFEDCASETLDII